MIMKDRMNKTLKDVVTRGIEISLNGGEFLAISHMVNRGVPNSVIARVIYQQENIRSCDLSVIEQLTN